MKEGQFVVLTADFLRRMGGGCGVDNVTERTLGMHVNHSVAGSLEGAVRTDPCLRERCPSRKQRS